MKSTGHTVTFNLSSHAAGSGNVWFIFQILSLTATVNALMKAFSTLSAASYWKVQVWFSMDRLNPKFAFMYRLFLRASSASVLHNGLATRKLRKLFRPMVEAVATTVSKMEGTAPEDSVHLMKWMDEFDNRSECHSWSQRVFKPFAHLWRILLQLTKHFRCCTAHLTPEVYLIASWTSHFYLRTRITYSQSTLSFTEWLLEPTASAKLFSVQNHPKGPPPRKTGIQQTHAPASIR